MLSTKLNNLQILWRKQVLSVECLELHFRLELENLAFLCDFQAQTPPNLGQRCHRPSGTLIESFSKKLQKLAMLIFDQNFTKDIAPLNLAKLENL